MDISQPFQPKDKETILSMAKDKHNFMVDWYKKYPWLTVCTSQCKVFCFYCKVIEKQNMLTFSKKKEMTFTMHGFNNWKKALQRFSNHEHCSAHQEAVMKWQLAKKTESSIGVQLSTAHQKLQTSRRQALLKQLYALRFLLRQGIAIRGHTEAEGNLQQLLKAWTFDDSNMKSWLEANKYLSHVIVNEQITMMGLSVLRSLLASIKKCSPSWYSIIGDEATDVVNREQLNLSIRWVNDDYEVNEDPVGLFSVPDTTSNTLTKVIQDMLKRCSLPLSLCRGQAYDGAANMQGKRNGVVTKIHKDVSAALLSIALPTPLISVCRMLEESWYSFAMLLTQSKRLLNLSNFHQKGHIYILIS